MKILDKNDFIVSNWAGGKTTQLFIYPQNSEYKKQNFYFRLSTATVDVEKSVFTSLPNYHRKLMILDGEIFIKHENYHSKKLGKFELDEFEGKWKTSSKGKCTDFNVMTNEKYSSSVKYFFLEKNEKFKPSFNDNIEFYFIYIYSGKLSVYISHKETLVSKQKLLVFKIEKNQKFYFTTLEQSQIIVTSVSFQ